MKNRFPQYLSSPYQVLFWETDELAIIALVYICATNFGTFFAFNFAAAATWLSFIVIPYAYRFYKKKYPSGFLKHMLYFVGLKIPKHYPSSFINQFYE